MNIEEMMEFISDIRKNTSCNLTIGKALEELNEFNDEAVVNIDNSAMKDQYEACKQYGYEFFIMNLTGDYDSYRGYYEDLMIEVSENDRKLTVLELKNLLNKALKDGIMYGYKGGDFDISSNTLLWLDEYGKARGLAPLKFIKQDDNNVLLITKYVE